MKHLKKYLKNSGQIIRHYEMFIPKSGKEIEVTYRELPVLISSENSVVVASYSSFLTLSIKKRRGDCNSTTIGNPHSYVRRWGSSLSNYDGLVASIFSYQSEKIVKRRVHNALSKLVEKEYGSYGAMIDKLNAFLEKNG